MLSLQNERVPVDFFSKDPDTMKLTQIPNPCLAIALAAMALTACKQEAPKAKGPNIEAIQKKQLEESKETIADLKKDLASTDFARKEAEEQLRKNLEEPEVVLGNQLTSASAEASAVLGWLRASKKISAANPGLDETSDFDQAKARAQDCIQQEAEIGELFDLVQSRKKLSENDQTSFLLQRDLLIHCRLEMQALLKEGP